MPLLYYDNTRVSTYRDCPRKYFFRHYKDLLREGESIDLNFGLAWHEAMNVVWKLVHERVPDKEVHTKAMLAFMKLWIEKGFPAPTGENYETLTTQWPTKNPYVAMEMLSNYITQRKQFILDCSEVDIERPFAVPLGMTVEVKDERGTGVQEEVFYIGRLDKCVRHRQHGRVIIEHKTTGWYAKEGGFRSDYIEGFNPNSQVEGYLFAGNSLYDKGVKELFVDAALCHKTVHDKFKYIPINKSFAALDEWLCETKEWVRRLVAEQNYADELARKPPEETTPYPAFPRNTGSCHDFSGCSYRDICRYIPNPRTVKVPSGYKIEKWEPFDLLKIGEIMQNKERSIVV